VIGDLFTKLSICMNSALDRHTIGALVRELYGDRMPSRAGDVPVPTTEVNAS
jgi:hypothetical protein